MPTPRSNPPLSIWLAIGVLSLTGSLGLLGSGACGQEPKYIVMAVDDEFVRNSANTRFVSDVLAGTKPLESPEDIKKFEDFFKKGLFAQLTQPEKSGDLGAIRQTFFTRYFRTAKDPAAVKRLNELAVKYMSGMVRGTERGGFHPTVRYNALLLLGDLDQTPPPTTGPRPAPKPLKEAFAVLLDFYRKDPSDAIKVGALIGIARHAKYSVLDDADGKIAKLFLEQVGQQLPAGRDPETHDWLRRQAIEILGDMGQSATNPDVNAALVKLVGDDQSALSIRSAAAAVLGKILKAPSGVKIDGAGLTRGLAQLVVDACEYEKTRADERGEVPSRRRLAYHLACARGAAASSKARVGDPDKKVLANLEKVAGEVLQAIDRQTITDEMLNAELAGITDRLAQAGGATAGAPAAAPAGGAEPAAPADPAATPDPFG